MMPEEAGNRAIILKTRGGGIAEIKDTYRSADSLHFVLLHPKGTDGWSPDQIMIGTRDGDSEEKRITCNKFYKYRLMQREGETN